MNKTSRLLLHAVFITVGIDTQTQTVQIKPLFQQVDPVKSKPYLKYIKSKFNRRSVQIKRLNYKLPAIELVTPYEKKKDDFVNLQSKNLESEIDKQENNNKNEEAKQIEDIVKFHWERGVTTIKDLAEILGEKPSNLSKKGVAMLLRRLNHEKHLQSTSNMPILPT